MAYEREPLKNEFKRHRKSWGELPEAQKAALLAQIPLQRLGQPEEIAHAVAFLASPEAGYITGTEMHVNGGMFMG